MIANEHANTSSFRSLIILVIYSGYQKKLLVVSVNTNWANDIFLKASKKIRIVMTMKWRHCYFCFLLLLKASVVIKTLIEISACYVYLFEGNNLHWFLKIAQECLKSAQEKFSDWYKALFHYYFSFSTIPVIEHRNKL